MTKTQQAEQLSTSSQEKTPPANMESCDLHSDNKRIFVLDTNVLMHDPTALFRFQEHDIFLPMVVLEELDKGKKGVSEVARNVRQVSRFLNDLIQAESGQPLSEGVSLDANHIFSNGKIAHGKLYFQTQTIATNCRQTYPVTHQTIQFLG